MATVAYNSKDDQTQHWVERLGRYDNERVSYPLIKRPRLDLSLWDTPWIRDLDQWIDEESARSHDGDSDGDLTMQTVPATTSAPLPRRRPTIRRSRSERNCLIPSQRTWPLINSDVSCAPPSPTIEEQRRFSQDIKLDRRRRSFSVPELKPAQELHINTLLPLKLPPTDLYAKPPQLAYPTYPTSWQPHGSSCQRDEKATSSSFHNDDEYSSKHLRWTESTSSFLSSQSDGSWHGDAGDDDPESQLARAIEQTSQQPPTETTEGSTRIPTIVDQDDLHAAAIQEHSGKYLSNIASMLLDNLAPVLSMLDPVRESNQFDSDEDFATRSPPTASPRHRSQSVDEMAINDMFHRRPLRLSSTPTDLGAEVRQMRAHRQSHNPISSHRSGWGSLFSWLMPSIAEVDAFTEREQENNQESLDGYLDQWSHDPTSFMSLPSLLSPTHSLPSLSTTNSVKGGYEEFLEDDEDQDLSLIQVDEDEAPRPFGQEYRRHSGFGLSTYADETHAFQDATICGRTDSAHVRKAEEIRSRRQGIILRKNKDLLMQMTPVENKLLPKDKDSILFEKPSPLWDESLGDSPYRRSWNSVLGLSSV